MSEATTIENWMKGSSVPSVLSPILTLNYSSASMSTAEIVLCAGDSRPAGTTCPTCRQVTPIPANGVTGVQSAFQVKELLEVLEEYKKHKDTATSQEGAVSDMTHPTSSKKGTPYCSVHGGKELYCETWGANLLSLLTPRPETSQP